MLRKEKKMCVCVCGHLPGMTVLLQRMAIVPLLHALSPSPADSVETSLFT